MTLRRVQFPAAFSLTGVCYSSEESIAGRAPEFIMNQHNEGVRQCFSLKPLAVEDLQQIAGWYEDIEDLTLIESKLPVPLNAQSLEKAWQNDLEQKEPRTSYLFSIRDGNLDPVGHVGLQDINYAHGNCVVFIFVRKDMRRSGVAMRALALVLDLAFLQLRMHRVTTYVHSGNMPSIALIKRLGFVDEGRLREGCFLDGDYCDVKVVGLLCEEWKSSRHPLSSALDDRVSVAFGTHTGCGWNWPLN